jgi:serine/threonine protein kinase
MHTRCEIDLNASQANVLIDDIGKACIADFGLSKIKYDALSKTSTMKGLPPAGTLRFMAPEVMEGKITKVGDIYSFGMVIYQVGFITDPLFFFRSDLRRHLLMKYPFKQYLKEHFGILYAKNIND